VLGTWASEKRSSFPRWNYHEIINEAYICAHYITHRYDKKRSSYTTFLWNSLYDPVARSYFKAFEVAVTRTGPNKARQYEWRTTQLDPDIYLPIEHNFTCDPYALHAHQPTYLHLLARGYTQRQAAYATNVHESSVSHKINKLRNLGRESFDATADPQTPTAIP
tara:strand:+ start:291 stop:782 length:492 start_codon:yes stop_codon:yes gene_type:complete